MSRIIKVAEWAGRPRASVIFVHGLSGHAYKTWRSARNEESFWPRWLAQDVEGVAVYTLAYEAPTSNWLGTAMPLQDRAVNVLECLLGSPSLRDGPVVFICHSLGHELGLSSGGEGLAMPVHMPVTGQGDPVGIRDRDLYGHAAPHPHFRVRVIHQQHEMG